MPVLPFSIPGNLGTNAGAASDGVLIGQITAKDPDTVLLKTQALAGLCVVDDGGVQTTKSTEFNEATADDVPVLPATPAVDDAAYFGHATSQFARVDMNITTQGAGTWTITWEYYNGSAWTALSGVTDGTTGFTATTGWKTVSFTLPTDWASTDVNSISGYWVRARVSAYTSVTTQPLVGQGYIIGETPTWTDDTTDFTDAGAGDVALLPAYPVVGDGIYIGLDEQFCKLKVTTSQERTGTATLKLKYWNGSAWTEVTTYDDDSAGWSGAAGTHLIHFVPPSDWAANTAANGPNSQTGYFVSVEMTAITDVTQQPLATQGWVLPLKTGTDGAPMPDFPGGAVSSIVVSASAQTASGSTQDSVFLLVNAYQGTSATFTWTKADPQVNATVSLTVYSGDEVLLVQITEDGTTEFADASVRLTV